MHQQLSTLLIDLVLDSIPAGVTLYHACTSEITCKEMQIGLDGPKGEVEGWVSVRTVLIKTVWPLPLAAAYLWRRKDGVF